MQPSDGTHRAKALVKLQRTAKLMKPPFASTPGECSRIVRCGENLKVSGGDKEGSSSQGCLPEAIPRCVAACRRSPPDISLTLSVRRADLCRFTKRVTRMYLLCDNATEPSDRVWMGTWRRHVSMCPSRRRQRTVPRRASGGTCAYRATPHIVGTKLVPTLPLSAAR